VGHPDAARYYSRSAMGAKNNNHRGNASSGVIQASSDYAMNDAKYQDQKKRGSRRMRSQQTSNSRDKSKRGKSKHSLNKVSSFEQFEEIRFSCYELNLKLGQVSQACEAAQEQAKVDEGADKITIPINLWNNIVKASAELKTDFEVVQKLLTDNYENQQKIHQRQKSKNRIYKLKLKDYENQS
jgi:hypothetical protein